MSETPDFLNFDRYFRPDRDGVLKHGAENDACINLRLALAMLGVAPLSNPDHTRRYTDDLARAVRDFQVAYGHPAPDGVCGPGTAGMLAAALMQKVGPNAFKRGMNDPQRRADGHVFISYAAADRSRVEPLVALIRGWGFSVWFDVDGIQGGENWELSLPDNLERAYMVIACLSAQAVASHWVKSELSYADMLGRPILPLPMEDLSASHPLSAQLERRQRISMTPAAPAALDVETLVRLHAALLSHHAARG